MSSDWHDIKNMREQATISFHPEFKDTTTYYIYTNRPPFDIGDADPGACEHEWWEDSFTSYTTFPVSHRQVCRLCGSERLRYEEQEDPRKLHRWKKVEE